MKNLALIIAAAACVALTAPASASDLVSGRVQLSDEKAQTTDFSSHRRWRHRHHRHWRHHHRHCWKVWRYGRRVIVCR